MKTKEVLQINYDPTKGFVVNGKLKVGSVYSIDQGEPKILTNIEAVESNGSTTLKFMDGTGVVLSNVDEANELSSAVSNEVLASPDETKIESTDKKTIYGHLIKFENSSFIIDHQPIIGDYYQKVGFPQSRKLISITSLPNNGCRLAFDDESALFVRIAEVGEASTSQDTTSDNHKTNEVLPTVSEQNKEMGEITWNSLGNCYTTTDEIKIGNYYKLTPNTLTGDRLHLENLPPFLLRSIEGITEEELNKDNFLNNFMYELGESEDKLKILLGVVGIDEYRLVVACLNKLEDYPELIIVDEVILLEDYPTPGEYFSDPNNLIGTNSIVRLISCELGLEEDIYLKFEDQEKVFQAACVNQIAAEDYEINFINQELDDLPILGATVNRVYTSGHTLMGQITKAKICKSGEYELTITQNDKSIWIKAKLSEELGKESKSELPTSQPDIVARVDGNITEKENGTFEIDVWPTLELYNLRTIAGAGVAVVEVVECEWKYLSDNPNPTVSLKLVGKDKEVTITNVKVTAELLQQELITLRRINSDDIPSSTIRLHSKVGFTNSRYSQNKPALDIRTVVSLSKHTSLPDMNVGGIDESSTPPKVEKQLILPIDLIKLSELTSETPPEIGTKYSISGKDEYVINCRHLGKYWLIELLSGDKYKLEVNRKTTTYQTKRGEEIYIQVEGLPVVDTFTIYDNEQITKLKELFGDKFETERDVKLLTLTMQQAGPGLKEVSKGNVLTCAYNATKTFMEYKGLGLLRSEDENWYKELTCVQSNGLQAAYTFTALHELVADHGVGISKIWVNKNNPQNWTEHNLWINSLGCNPLALIDQETSNSQYLQRILANNEDPEYIELMTNQVNSYKFEYTDTLPSEALISQQGGNDSGHAEFRHPRSNRSFGWLLACSFDKLNNIEYLIDPPKLSDLDLPSRNYKVNLWECLAPDNKKLRDFLFAGRYDNYNSNNSYYGRNNNFDGRNNNWKSPGINPRYNSDNFGEHEHPFLGRGHKTATVTTKFKKLFHNNKSIIRDPKSVNKYNGSMKVLIDHLRNIMVTSGVTALIRDNFYDWKRVAFKYGNKDNETINILSRFSRQLAICNKPKLTIDQLWTIKEAIDYMSNCDGIGEFVVRLYANEELQ